MAHRSRVAYTLFHMTREPLRYLRWWVSNTSPYTIVLVTFFVILGPTLFVGSAVDSGFRDALGGASVLLVGLYFLLYPVFEYRASSQPDSKTAERKEPGA